MRRNVAWVCARRMAVCVELVPARACTWRGRRSIVGAWWLRRGRLQQQQRDQPPTNLIVVLVAPFGAGKLRFLTT